MSTINDANLAVDESERLARHEAVKGQVRSEVQGEIAQSAAVAEPVDQARADQLARDFREQAITEVADTEAEIHRARGAARFSQFVDYAFYLLYGIIGLEILLEFLGANDRNGFKQMVDGLSSPFLAPFIGLMPTIGNGPFRLVLSYIAALIVYLMLHLAINGLLRLFAHRKVAV